MSDPSQSVTTRLLTLLNVSATKAEKRTFDSVDDFVPGEKFNKRKTVQIAEADPEAPVVTDITVEEKTAVLNQDDNEDVVGEYFRIMYDLHLIDFPRQIVRIHMNITLASILPLCLNPLVLLWTLTRSNHQSMNELDLELSVRSYLKALPLPVHLPPLPTQ